MAKAEEKEVVFDHAQIESMQTCNCNHLYPDCKYYYKNFEAWDGSNRIYSHKCKVAPCQNGLEINIKRSIKNAFKKTGTTVLPGVL